MKTQDILDLSLHELKAYWIVYPENFTASSGNNKLTPITLTDGRKVGNADILTEPERFGISFDDLNGFEVITDAERIELTPKETES